MPVYTALAPYGKPTQFDVQKAMAGAQFGSQAASRQQAADIARQQLAFEREKFQSLLPYQTRSYELEEEKFRRSGEESAAERAFREKMFQSDIEQKGMSRAHEAALMRAKSAEERERLRDQFAFQMGMQGREQQFATEAEKRKYGFMEKQAGRENELAREKLDLERGIANSQKMMSELQALVLGAQRGMKYDYNTGQWGQDPNADENIFKLDQMIRKAEIDQRIMNTRMGVIEQAIKLSEAGIDPESMESLLGREGIDQIPAGVLSQIGQRGGRQRKSRNIAEFTADAIDAGNVFTSHIGGWSADDFDEPADWAEFDQNVDSFINEMRIRNYSDEEIEDAIESLFRSPDSPLKPVIDAADIFDLGSGEQQVFTANLPIFMKKRMKEILKGNRPSTDIMVDASGFLKQSGSGFSGSVH